MLTIVDLEYAESKMCKCTVVSTVTVFAALLFFATAVGAQPIRNLEDAKRLPKDAKSADLQGVTDEVVEFIAQHAGLERLTISESRELSSPAMQKALSIPTLYSLRLTRCSGVDEAAILSLSRTVTDLIINACEPCPTPAISILFRSNTLIDLRLHDMAGINKVSVGASSSTSSIARLQLSLGMWEDSGLMRAVARLPKLEHLTLSARGGSDADLEQLAACKSLRYLSIEGGYATGRFTGPLFASVPLTEFKLDYLPNLRPELLEFKEAKSLRRLSLYTQTLERDSGLDFLNPLSELEVLGLSDTRYLSGHWVKAVKSLGKLKTLVIRNTNVIDSDLTEIAKLPNLEEIVMTGCDNITPKGVRQLLKLPKLKILDVYACKGIEVKDVISFYRAKPDCQFPGFPMHRGMLEDE